MQKLVHLKPPQYFTPKIKVASCFFEVANEILLLKKNDDKLYGGTWGVPAGKLEAGESPSDGIIREVFEETGLCLLPKDFVFLQIVYVRYPEIDFVYSMFKSTFSHYPTITLSPNEHQEAKWVTPACALQMNLIPGEDECINLIYSST